MTGKLVPANPVREIGRTKGRVHQLERKLLPGRGQTYGFNATFSLAGALVESTSGKKRHPIGGNLWIVYADLNTAGSTATTIDVIKNGTTIKTLTLPAGITYNEIQMSAEFGPRSDTLQFAVTAAGTDAETLTVTGEFDR